MSEQQALKEYHEAREKQERLKGVSSNDLMPLDEALECLPDVSVTPARRFIHREMHALFEELSAAIIGRQDKNLDGLHKKFAPDVILTMASFEDLFLKIDRNAYVTLNGARLLLRMHGAEVLPRSRTRRPGDIDRITQYASLDEAVIAEKVQAAKDEQVRAVEADRAARLEILDNPDAIPESDFCYSLLDDVFVRHKGRGIGTKVMSIGGIQVSKTVIPFHSNSRKSRDYGVRFTWTDSSGAERVIENPSRFEGNRGNDPDRNWGMSRRE